MPGHALAAAVNPLHVSFCQFLLVHQSIPAPVVLEVHTPKAFVRLSVCAQRIVQFLAAQPEGGFRLPSGTLLTPRAFQTLGLSGLCT